MNDNQEDKSAWQMRLDYYEERCRRHSASIEQLESKSTLVGRLRVAMFLLAAFALAVALQQGDVLGTQGAIAAGVFIGFVVLVAIHDRFQETMADLVAVRRISQDQVARLNRRWDDVVVPRVDVPDEARAVADDLDLFGKASLFHLLCTAHTKLGRQKLRDWLLAMPDPESIAERQAASGHMAEDFETRERLALEGSRLADSHTGPQQMCEWAEEPFQLARWKGLTVLARALPLTALASIFLALMGVLAGEAAFFICCFVVLANLIVSVCFTGTIHSVFNRVSSPNGEVQRYVRIFDILERTSAGSAAIQRLQSAITIDGVKAQTEIQRLGRVMAFANLRHDALFAIFYVVLQLTVLWDIHVFWFLEHWKSRNRKRVVAWFDAIAEFEALSSLATLRHDNPDWQYPTVDEQQTSFAARQLGHPLLSEDSRVVNDVSVGPPGAFLLVTGSNMSGKSTLLRSIGTNLILAQVGGPVCAAELRTLPVIVATSMRVQDSLDDGISFYMAELRRLKQIVDQSKSLRDDDGHSLFFLLDEILQGTNSAERHIAVSRVLKHLLTQRALGAVSTHDLELADSEYLATHCRCVHFRETLVKDDRRMTFDYQMRDGVAPTTNALVLLEMVGLGD